MRRSVIPDLRTRLRLAEAEERYLRLLNAAEEIPPDPETDPVPEPESE